MCTHTHTHTHSHVHSCADILSWLQLPATPTKTPRWRNQLKSEWKKKIMESCKKINRLICCLFSVLSSEIILFVRQWMETYPTDFDPSTSSHTHYLSLLQPLTAQSTELARLVETIRHSKDTSTIVSSPTLIEEHAISRLRVNSSSKGECVCVWLCSIHLRKRSVPMDVDAIWHISCLLLITLHG